MIIVNCIKVFIHYLNANMSFKLMSFPMPHFCKHFTMKAFEWRMPTETLGNSFFEKRMQIVLSLY